MSPSVLARKIVEVTVDAIFAAIFARCNLRSMGLAEEDASGLRPELPADDEERHFGIRKASLFYRLVHSMRPWSFTASYFPVLLTALALASYPPSSAALWAGRELVFLLRFGVLLVGALGVHAAANLTNTYYDFVHKVRSQLPRRGAALTPTRPPGGWHTARAVRPIQVDTGKQADDRTLLDGKLTPGSSI
eukprot:SAG11_NODE_8695_length_986_cov_1.618940_1_plen_191_part_00